MPYFVATYTFDIGRRKLKEQLKKMMFVLCLVIIINIIFNQSLLTRVKSVFISVPIGWKGQTIR